MSRTRSWTRNRRVFAVLCAFVALGALVGVSATSAGAAPIGGAATPLWRPVTNLGAPFSNWNVQVSDYGSSDRVLNVSFDSPALGQRITNRVYLPSQYSDAGQEWPVLYYLHGTVYPTLDNGVFGPITKNEALLKAIGPGGGAEQTDLFDFQQNMDRARFLVVAPDTSTQRSICETCAWINGRKDIVPNIHPITATTLQADTFLHQELYPLIQALFNVRTDRGGRGVMGFSMGGASAYLQAMLHPDQYAFAASVSGGLDVVDNIPLRAIWEGVGYNRDQGYGTDLTDKTYWDGLNPKNLASNLTGTGIQVLSSAGDACAKPEDVSAPDCERVPAATNPLAATVETCIAQEFLQDGNLLPSEGVHEVRVQDPGVHGANNHRVFSDNVVPMANSVFASGISTPATFNYRTVASNFSVWGYTVSVSDPNDPRFLDMTESRTDGRAFDLTGNGTVTVTTPAKFVPGQRYKVTMTPASGTPQEYSATADATGRIQKTVELGGTANLLGVVGTPPSTVALSVQPAS